MNKNNQENCTLLMIVSMRSTVIRSCITMQPLYVIKFLRGKFVVFSGYSS